MLWFPLNIAQKNAVMYHLSVSLGYQTVFAFMGYISFACVCCNALFFFFLFSLLTALRPILKYFGIESMKIKCIQ